MSDDEDSFGGFSEFGRDSEEVTEGGEAAPMSDSTSLANNGLEKFEPAVNELERRSAMEDSS